MKNYEEKLYKALKTIIHNSVDNIGLPKKATVKQLLAAKKVANDFEKEEKMRDAELNKKLFKKTTTN